MQGVVCANEGVEGKLCVGTKEKSNSVWEWRRGRKVVCGNGGGEEELSKEIN
jgi:hypothetical protein